jgi:hypothetical protein
MRLYLRKLFTKIGLVEWLKVKALSLSPSTEEKKKKKKGGNQINRKVLHCKRTNILVIKKSIKCITICH